jgi:hypothetical protein
MEVTLSNALCAIIGVAWLDSNKMSTAFKAIVALGCGYLVASQECCVRMLSLRRVGDSETLSVQVDSVAPQNMTMPQSPLIDQGKSISSIIS